MFYHSCLPNWVLQVRFQSISKRADKIKFKKMVYLHSCLIWHGFFRMNVLKWLGGDTLFYVKDWYRRKICLLNMHLFNSCTPSFKKQGLKINDLFVSLKEHVDMSILIFHCFSFWLFGYGLQSLRFNYIPKHATLHSTRTSV